MFDFIIGNSRPFMAILQELSFNIATDVEGLRTLRLLSFAFLIASYLLICNHLGHKTDSFHLPVALGFLTPAFQTYVHWANSWTSSLALFLSILGWTSWCSHAMMKKVLGVISISLSFWIYQPIALFFFSIIAVQIIYLEKSTKFFLNQIKSALSLTILGVAPAYAGASVIQGIFSVSGSSRNALVGFESLGEKVVWLLTRPPLLVGRLFQVEHSSLTVLFFSSVPFFLAVFFNLKAIAKSRSTPTFEILMIATLPLILSYSLLIPLKESATEFRVMPGLSWGFAVLAIQSVINLILTLCKGLHRRRLSLFILLFFSITMVGFTFARFSESIENPYQKKKAFILESIENCVRDGKLEEYVVVPKSGISQSNNAIGQFSIVDDTGNNGNSLESVQLIVKSFSALIPQKHVRLYYSDSEFNSRECAIDFNRYTY